MKMLEYTFQHIVGFGELREKELRNRNIFTWDYYEKKKNLQLSLPFGDSKSILHESRLKLLKKMLIILRNDYQVVYNIELLIRIN